MRGIPRGVGSGVGEQKRPLSSGSEDESEKWTITGAGASVSGSTHVVKDSIDAGLDSRGGVDEREVVDEGIVGVLVVGGGDAHIFIAVLIL